VAGLVYRTVRGTTRLAGRGADALLGAAAKLLPGTDSPPAREAALAALNGVYGDHLEASGNPLAIGMSLRVDGQRAGPGPRRAGAALPQAGGPHAGAGARPVHERPAMDNATATTTARRWRATWATPLYLHYNSGRHVSSNGRDFARLLDELVALAGAGDRAGHRRPQHGRAGGAQRLPPGGSSRACPGRGGCSSWSSWARRTRARRWNAAACWWTGCWVSAPTSRRSRGWARRAAPASPTCASATCRTPTGRAAAATTSATTTACPRRCPPAWTCLVAATTADHVDSLRSALLGDGLVRLSSALGQHRNPVLALAVPDDAPARDHTGQPLGPAEPARRRTATRVTQPSP
jgi:hypothetical protein